MKRVLIYDLPTRLFHWLFTLLFLFALGVAHLVDDESVIFNLHMLAGLCVGFLVLLRIFWLFAGTKHARFSGLVLAPSELARYARAIVMGEKEKWVGHNPASSWATVVFLALGLAMAGTGLLMVTGAKEQLEEIHEALSWAFAGMAVLHAAGLALHNLRHRDGIGFTMIDGRKQGVPESEAISSARPLPAFALAAMMALFAGYLATQFDATDRTLNFFGKKLELGGTKEHQ